MNLLLLYPQDRHQDRRSEETFRITGRRADHVQSVLRAVAGDELRVGLLNGPRGTGKVAAIDQGVVELRCEFESVIPARPPLDLVLAIPRPKSLRKLLPEITTFGVNRIVLLRTWRVAKPYLSVGLLKPAEYRPLLHDGMMQGRHTLEPCVTVEPLFKPFVEDRLAGMVDGSVHRIVADPSAIVSIAELDVHPDARVVAAIGPEGGFVPYELDAFQRRRFTPVRLGPTPLRVETACVALMAQIELLRMMGT